ncbi:MAG: phosphatidate cytidylyltransferase [Prevotellaceae bacterium]|nr:phosphatidate cytidylyltransferase [Prevotella sp.]MDD7258344.1 phosphatidate cytidylyltransferase [Prevotellaceae bacterium]MDY6129902.1 phosphatidate cytidylyltransferase [Prevotella sp.]
MKNLIVRSITGVFFVAAIVVSFLTPVGMTSLFALVTGLTIWEFCGLANGIEGVSVNRFISTVAGVYLFLAVGGFCSDITSSGAVFIPYLLTLVYLFISELYLKNANPVNDWAYTMLSQMYIALPFSTINVLAFNADTTGAVHFNFILPLSVFIFLWVNDSGAYCCGSLLGKHKLFPRISPGKSWEGSIGGAIFVLAAAVAVYYLHPESPLSLPAWLGLGLVVVVFGTWGDLVESLFKRTLGIKDSGNILPGHGGMLDRFDSSLMAFPASVVYIYSLTLIA